MSDKNKKRFKIILIVLAIILVAEVIYFGFRLYSNRKNSTFSSGSNAMIVSNDKIIMAGFSDYKHSDFNDYEDGYEKATVFVYDSNKVVSEIGLKLGFNSHYNDIVKTSDGYVAVGSIEMTKEHNENKLSEGVIVKYDNNFKIKWRKNISNLGKTEFFKVKVDDDGNIVVCGSSVYGEGYIGNHTTGGGMLLKYSSSGKELMRVNYGGPYSGSFNDLLLLDDGYIVVGLGKANSGVIIKYSLSGKKIWTGSYGYTDSNGFRAVDKLGDKYVVATTKVVDVNKMSNYQAALVVFSSSLKRLDDVKYSSYDVNMFSDVLVHKGGIYVVGSTGRNLSGKVSTDAFVLKYDSDLDYDEEVFLKGNNNDYYNSILTYDDAIYVSGYSNSKFDLEGFNGYDYFPVVKKYSFDLE